MSKAVQNDFSQGKMWRNILTQAIPLTIAQTVQVLYNIVDRIYLGHLPGASSLALTGVGLIFPIVTLVTAFCNLFGSGGAPLCSIARGAGDTDRAERIMGTTFTMLVASGAVLMVLCYLFKKPVLYLFGASDETYFYADAYLSVYLLGTPFVMIGVGMNGFINAQGFARIGMLTIVLGAVLNVILDPLFIFVFDLGVRGAAIATVLSQAVSCVWVMLFLTGKRAILKLKKEYLRPAWRLLGEIVSLGLAGFIMAATNCLVQITCNATLKIYGGDLYIGVMTVINSIRELLSLPINGITDGAKPVLGYNYGARRYDRVRTRHYVYVGYLHRYYHAVLDRPADLPAPAFLHVQFRCQLGRCGNSFHAFVFLRVLFDVSAIFRSGRFCGFGKIQAGGIFLAASQSRDCVPADHCFAYDRRSRREWCFPG